jgi:sugar/nucleoside kinase (ribokinase family)
MFVVIGTVTADLLVQSDTPLSNRGGDGFRSSNLVFTDAPLAITMGGNGGNSAYVLAGLGVPTALCGAVGQDILGDTLGKWLETKGVDLRGLTRSPTHATSTSTIIMTDAANQVVFHHLGSSAEASVEAIPDTLLAGADALLATSFPIMPRLRNGGFAQALARVREAGGITALDIGPAIGAPVTLDELTPLLPMVNYLIANTHELVSLTGAPDWSGAVGLVLAAGAQHVVIKQGELGASIWSATEQVHVPGFSVDANISVGAGDSFNVGLLYGLQQRWSHSESLRFGNAVAALVVASPQGVLGSPSLSQVKAFLDAHK